MFLQLFFNQLVQQKRILKNIIWLGIGEVGMLLSKLILVILIARIFYAEGYGKFSFAFNVASIFLMVANFGTGRLIVRELSRGRKFIKTLPYLYGFRLFTCLLACFLIWITSSFITPDPFLKRLIILFGFVTALSALVDFYYAIFQGYERFCYQGIVQLFQSCLLVIGGLLAAWKFPYLKSFVFIYLASAFIALIIAILNLFFKEKIFLLPRIRIPVWKKYASLSWPIALGGILMEIFARLDSIMMGYWKQFQAVGWYNANYRIIGILMGIGTLISFVFFPSISKAFIQSKRKFLQLFLSQCLFLAVVWLPSVIMGCFFAPHIIRIIYGQGFLAGVFSFKILLFVLGCAYMFLILRNLFIISNQQRTFVVLMILGILLNFVLNYFLIPKYSLNGAAFATLITYIVLVIVAMIILAKRLQVNLRLFKKEMNSHTLL